MAALGPPEQQVRMAHQQVWAALEVALRVPCLYIIDAIFNSYYDSSQSRFCIGLQIFLRLLERWSQLSLIDPNPSPRCLSTLIDDMRAVKTCADSWVGETEKWRTLITSIPEPHRRRESLR
ncbi:E3 ubiquitin-protein ligase RNF139 isoform X3 [Sagmatias obliquidens]|uniref:E3 ubiquitin-protein ligase RNF139 isoform X3 n=1 Tax=Sagmatias obliquidens TaxID=3371155 RepID=UPI000F4441C5|nr:E3 ubiquitin-protein ligase RNF139 isoform X3 [Lagenorhynchus obliquidens]